MHRQDRYSLQGQQAKSLERPQRKLLGLGFFGINTLALLFAVLLSSPWMLGGRHPYLYQMICLGVLASVSFWLLSQFQSHALQLTIPTITLPLFLAILFGLFQLTPLSPNLVSKVSPTASRLWSLSEAPDNWEKPEQTKHATQSQTISLYPASTRYNISLITLAAVMFLLSAHFLSGERTQVILWWLLLINGAALSLFGVVQQMSWDGKIYWFFQPEQVGMPFGPYINHNHAAGYLLMCLGGGLGLLMSNRVIKQDSKKRSRRLKKTSQWSYVFAAILTLCILIGILCSLSRGAFVAMAGAGLVTLFVSAKYTGRGMKFPTQLVAIVVLAVVVLVGMGLSSTISDRINSIADQDISMNPRLKHWEEASQTVPDFWLTGSGLGTYRYIHRFYITHPAKEWFYNADNQYLEALVDGGVVGLGLMLLLIGLMLGVTTFSMRKVPGLRVRPFTLAISFAVLSQSIHAFFDFGLYAPANMLLLAAICGAGAGKACQFSELANFPSLIALSRLRSPVAAGGFIVVLMVFCLFPTWEAHTALRSKTAQDRLVEVMTDPNFSPAERELEVFDYSQYVEQHPDNMRLQVAAAQAWIKLYRHRAYWLLDRKHNPANKKEVAVVNLELKSKRDPVIWEQTSLDHLSQRAFQLSRLKQIESVNGLRNQPIIKETLRPAFRHLLQARRSSPLLPYTHFALAKLSFLVRNPNGENAFLLPVTNMATRRVDLMFRAGRFYFHRLEYERAAYYWQKSMTNSDRYSGEIYDLALKRSDHPEYADQLLSNSPKRLIEMAQDYSSQGEEGIIRKRILKHADHILQETTSSNPEFFYQRGVVAELLYRPKEAAKYFQQAVQRAPHNLAWRFRYAHILEADGRLKEALQQAKTCSRLDPQNDRYKKYYMVIHARAPVSDEP